MFRAIVFASAAFLFAVAAVASIPTSMTIQGRATDAAGNPISTGDHSFVFRIFDSEFGVGEVWPGGAGEMQTLSTSDDGLWMARIGALIPLTATVFESDQRWLQITVDGVTLPRVRIVTSPYAFQVGTVDGASGGNITSEVSIGLGHTITTIGAFVAGSSNTVTGESSVIAGGIQNIAGGVRSTVAGGESNQATGLLSAVGGGAGNIATSTGSSVSGGFYNKARGALSHVGGGGGLIEADSNTARGWGAVVGGGSANHGSGQYSSVGGGRRNRALGDYAHVGGGGGNSDADSNVAHGTAATIGGGLANRANGDYSNITGGRSNSAAGIHSAVCGGFTNRADGELSFACGGGCISDGYCSFACGGGNEAHGAFSFAAGWTSRANHDRCFVWSGAPSGSFTSTATDQFLVRAPGGFGVGTESPEVPFHVFKGSAGATTAWGDAVAAFENSTHGYLTLLTPTASESGILFGNPSHATDAGIIYNNSAAPGGLQFRTDNNNVRMTLSSAGVLTVLGNVCAANIVCPSDARLKRNVETLPNALEAVERLRGVHYEWNREQFTDREFAVGEQIGLIAQEVRDVVPQAVIEQPDGFLAVDYARLVPLLIEGMKEQQQLIDKQNERIANLEKKLAQ